MVLEELTSRECRAIVERAHLARLACARNNQPYIVPVHVNFYDGSLYAFAPMGQKIEWMRQNPLVCVEIDELTTHKQWDTVIVFGEYEELPDLPEYTEYRTVAERLFQRHPVWWEPGSVTLARHSPSPRILFRILISHMTGRRARPDASEAQYLPGRAEPNRHRRLPPVLRRVLRRP
jgi:hypothetical protein